MKEATQLSVICGGASDSFTIVDSRNDLNLNQAKKAGADVQVDYYIGSACTTDHMAVYNGRANGADDLLLLTIRIETDFDIDFSGLDITCTPLHKVDYSYVEYDTFNLVFDEDMSRITTKQPIIHSQTLFEVGGKYYISNNNSCRASYGYGLKQGICIVFTCIDESVSELYEAMNDNVTPVYGQDANYFSPNGYDKETTYLKSIEVPGGCTFWFEQDYDKILVGFQTLDGSEAEEDGDCELNGVSSVPMYTSEDGSSMVFLCVD